MQAIASISRVHRLALFAVLILIPSLSSIARGQEKKEEKPDFPEPRTVIRKTTDGFLIRCTYYYGCLDPKKKKDTVPVLIVHDYGEEARDYDGLATFLQHQGHAVLVPDLRGHGGSTQLENGAQFTRSRHRGSPRPTTTDQKPSSTVAVLVGLPSILLMKFRCSKYVPPL